MSVELFTATSRITGEIRTRHIHIRDELNETRRSILIFDRVVVSELGDLKAPRLVSGGAWLEKSTVLLALPVKIKGTTSMLTQRSLQSRLGRNEHRILVDLPEFRIVGNFYFVGSFRIESALRRDRMPFVSLSSAEVTFLPDPAISFTADEIVLNADQVRMLCTGFEST